MAARTIKFEGKTYQFPDDATEQEISEALASVHDQSQGPPNAGLSGVSRPRNPILEDSHNPSSPVYQDSPFHESTSAENLGGWVEEGPIKTGKGVKEMVTPGTFKRGVHDTISGVGTTSAPAAAFAPPAALIRSAAGSYVGSKVGEVGAKAWGADDDTTQMVSDLGSVAGGYAGYKAPDIMAPPVRGMGRVVQRASSMPDLPVDTPSRSANIFSRVANVSRGAVSRGGRAMANYKVPQAPNIYNGDASGPLPGEPDLPTPVKPDGAVHHNDVTDHGELDKLLDQVSQQPEVRQSRDPVRADNTEHHNDVNPGYAAVDGTTTKLTGPLPPITSYHGTPSRNLSSIIRKGITPSRYSDPSDDLFSYSAEDPDVAKEFGGRLEYDPSRQGRDQVSVVQLSSPHSEMQPRTGELFDPNDKEYLRPGGFPKSEIRGVTTHIPPSDEPIPLPESPLTKSFSPDDVPTPNSDTLLRAIRSAPGWPENGLPNEPWDDIHAGDELSHALDTDPYNRPPDQQIQSPTYSGAERRGFSRSVGGLSDAADNNDFQTAKSSLGPDASISQVALEAQRLKLKRTGGK